MHCRSLITKVQRFIKLRMNDEYCHDVNIRREITCNDIYGDENIRSKGGFKL